MIRSKNGDIVHKLVNLRRPLLRIPTLAIHLDRQEKFEFNKETQLFPIAGMVAAELERLGDRGSQESNSDRQTSQDKGEDGFQEPLKSLQTRHHPRLVSCQHPKLDCTTQSQFTQLF